MQQLYKDRGFSEKATSIILQSWHQSSQKQCDGHIRKWLTGCSFCSQRQVDQIHPTVGVAVEFLTRLYKNGLSCSSINSERSALSEILNQTHFSQWVMVSILMLNTSWKVCRPPLPRYGKTWDVNLVLQYIGSIKASHASSFDHSSEKPVNSPFRYYRHGLRGNKVYFPA